MTDIEDLRRASMAVYLATEAGPASDLSAKLLWAVGEIERLREATILQAGTISVLTEEIGLLRVEIKRLEALTKETTHG